MNYTPQPKISVGAVAGALVAVFITVAQSYGITITPELAGALTVIIGFGAAYMFPEGAPPEPPAKS